MNKYPAHGIKKRRYHGVCPNVTESKSGMEEGENMITFLAPYHVASG